MPEAGQAKGIDVQESNVWGIDDMKPTYFIKKLRNGCAAGVCGAGVYVLITLFLNAYFTETKTIEICIDTLREAKYEAVLLIIGLLALLFWTIEYLKDNSIFSTKHL